MSSGPPSRRITSKARARWRRSARSTWRSPCDQERCRGSSRARKASSGRTSGSASGTAATCAAPDRHFPPPDIGPRDQVISRGGEDPFQRLEAGGDSAVLVGRQRRSGSPGAARELGTGQTRVLPGCGNEICRHALSVSEQIRSRAPDHRRIPRVATSHRLGEGLDVGVGESDAVLRARGGANALPNAAECAELLDWAVWKMCTAARPGMRTFPFSRRCSARPLFGARTSRRPRPRR